MTSPDKPLEAIRLIIDQGQRVGGPGGPGGGGPAGGAPTEPEATAPDYSEEALALAFARLHGGDLRYVAAWGQWYRWTGSMWRPDETREVPDLIRAVDRAAAESAPAAHIARSLASSKTASSVDRLSTSDRRVAATVDQWDADPWLLNTPGGAVDLPTGEKRPHRRDDYCTKIAAVEPGGSCVLWHAFLDKITAGDGELKLFLQRLAGYCATGLTTEHAMAFLYGTGANGKSTFINTVAAVLGDYAQPAPIELLIASHNERHPTELAGLRGARLVVATETEEGRRWAEARLKLLTGGDPILARYMRQDFFQFTPQFKLIVQGNHKPGLRTVDEAIRRRLHLVPFITTIPEGERDLELADKLRAEWPGILRWVIRGAEEWAVEGLRAPEAVSRATKDYLASEDALAQWIAECCGEGSGFATTAALFASWREWAERAGEWPSSMKRFSQALLTKGFEPAREASGRRGFKGLWLRDDLGGGML